MKLSPCCQLLPQIERHSTWRKSHRHETRNFLVGELPVPWAGQKTAIEFPIKAMGRGVYSVKCEINELPMNFILDTGCSDVSISSVESEFMRKNGYLNSSDYRGYITCQAANGESHKAREINIRKLSIGGSERISPELVNGYRREYAPMRFATEPEI